MAGVVSAFASHSFIGDSGGNIILSSSCRKRTPRRCGSGGRAGRVHRSIKMVVIDEFDRFIENYNFMGVPPGPAWSR
jgi:hypothetical protein